MTIALPEQPWEKDDTFTVIYMVELVMAFREK